MKEILYMFEKVKRKKSYIQYIIFDVMLFTIKFTLVFCDFVLIRNNEKKNCDVAKVFTFTKKV